MTQTLPLGDCIDLHSHSTSSDGDLSPKDLVLRAREHGVSSLALTDHDTLAGLAEARLTADDIGLRLIPGMEVSCVWRKLTLHIVALNFGFDNPVMQALESRQLDSRRGRAKRISDVLIKKGLPDLLDEVIALTPSGIPGRPHFAQAMVDRGIVRNMQDAFKLYLGAGKPGDIQSGWPDMVEVMAVLREAKAATVIAHPCKYNLTWTRLRELFSEFKAQGGDAVEVAVSGQKVSEINTLARECKRVGLQASCGSDFHSPKYSWGELGSAPKLPESVMPVWQYWQ